MNSKKCLDQLSFPFQRRFTVAHPRQRDFEIAHQVFEHPSTRRSVGIVEAACVGQGVEQEVRFYLSLQNLQSGLRHLALERGAVDVGVLHRFDTRHFTAIELADRSDQPGQLTHIGSTNTAVVG